MLTLSGRADGELLRTDKFAFTRVEAPNGAPSAVSLDASEVAENAAGAVVGALSASDPEGDAITFSVAADSPFEVASGQLKLRDGVALDFEAGSTVEVAVTVTDAKGATTTTTLAVKVTDVAEAPLAPSLTAEPIAENAPGAVVGTLSATSPEGRAVTFTTEDARFEVVDGTLKLRDGVALDFEEAAAATVSVTADDGITRTTGEVTVTVADANDAPTLAAGAALADARIALGQGGSVDLSVLGAADQDAGDTASYVATGAGGAALPVGFAVEGTALVVPADAPAGAYAVEVFATDGEADSDSVSFTVTVGEPAAFEPVVLQAEAGAIALAQAADGSQTQVRDADNPETGGTVALRPDFTGTGYVDYGNDAGDALTLTVTVPTAGAYDLNIRYASNTDRPLDLAINGAVAAAPLAFAATDPDGSGDAEGFDNWRFETRTVTLQAGENAIALSIPAGATTGPNLDRIEITAGGTGPIPAGDISADEDGDLFLDGPDGALKPDPGGLDELQPRRRRCRRGEGGDLLRRRCHAHRGHRQAGRRRRLRIRRLRPAGGSGHRDDHRHRRRRQRGHRHVELLDRGARGPADRHPGRGRGARHGRGHRHRGARPQLHARGRRVEPRRLRQLPRGRGGRGLCRLRLRRGRRALVRGRRAGPPAPTRPASATPTAATPIVRSRFR